MQFLFIALLAGLQITTSLCAPINPQSITGRSEENAGIVPLQSRATSKSKTPTAAQVKTAGDNFASDANTVSSSLNSLGSTTDTSTRKQLANTAFKAETDEDDQRAVLFAAGKNTDANSKIVANTPTVLDGLSSISKNPSDANTAKMLKSIEAARNPDILPSITALTKSAFQATGVQSTPTTFKATVGTQKIKALMASSSGSGGASSSDSSAKASTTKASTSGAKNSNN